MEEDDIFHNDPNYMKSLIDKTVQVTTVDGAFYTGIVYVIDPIYSTLILHTNVKSNEDYETTLIFRHALKSFRVLSEEEQKESEFKVSKKQIVKKWLQQMSIVAQEIGDVLKIEDQLIILPPYEAENCVCTNKEFLEDVQNVLRNMPTHLNNS